MLKKILLLLLLVTFLFFSYSPVKASENIAVSTAISYVVSETGMTTVTMKGTLTNTTAQYYASSYKMKLGFATIEKVRASDPQGNIAVVIDKSQGEYIVEIPFNTPAIGLGKSQTFTLVFDTPEIAKKTGSVWEIIIPGIEDQEAFTQLTVDVKVPPSFGEASYVKPQGSVSQTTYHFTKEHLKKSGISLGFGDVQTYAFRLIYHIKSTNVVPVTTEIALPPSTNYQEVSIDSISSKPLNVTEDADGNWLATYRLAPSEKKNIVVEGRVAVSLIPKQQSESEVTLAPYLKPQRYWESDNIRIKELATSLKTPAGIYEYVVKSLQYDFSRVTDDKKRAGALEVLQNPSSAVCLEFTDLFIALARAAGIPAREINGFGYTDNDKLRPLSKVQDILHSWPEYYDRELQTWIMVDPTWGNTTGGVDYFNVLDLNHITFVRKGKDSQYPHPAGGYKLPENIKDKDVDVSVTVDEVSEPQNFQIRADIPNEHSSLIPLSGKVVITNVGTVALTPQTISIKSQTLWPKTITTSIDKVPPYGYVEAPFSFEKPHILTNKKDLITITVAGKTIYQSVHISPLFFGKWFWPVLGGLISATILGTGLFIATFRAWRLFVSRRREQRPLRGESTKS